MTHEDEGHYAGKHPKGTVPDPALAEAVSAVQKDGKISCPACEAIANDKKVSMGEVGKTADLLELRIGECQLGLYGHQHGTGPHGKTIEAAKSVSPQLEASIRAALEEGRLSCAAAWGVASGNNVEKVVVAEACEALGIKMKPCQLGAF